MADERLFRELHFFRASMYLQIANWQINEGDERNRQRYKETEIGERERERESVCACAFFKKPIPEY